MENRLINQENKKQVCNIKQNNIQTILKSTIFFTTEYFTKEKVIKQVVNTLYFMSDRT